MSRVTAFQTPKNFYYGKKTLIKDHYNYGCKYQESNKQELLGKIPDIAPISGHFSDEIQ